MKYGGPDENRVERDPGRIKRLGAPLTSIVQRLFLWPRRESNPDLAFRKRLFSVLFITN